jgi:hypothetical protein
MAESTLEDYDPGIQASDTETFVAFHLPITTLERHRPWSKLYQDHDEKHVILYEPVERLSNGKWLIDVNSRAYVLSEDVLVAGMEAMEG